jgi:hypothetical protein
MAELGIWARYLRCLGVFLRCFAVFTVLTSPFHLCRVSNIGDAHAAEVPIAGDNEVARLTELVNSPFPVLSESLLNVQADSSGG